MPSGAHLVWSVLDVLSVLRCSHCVEAVLVMIHSSMVVILFFEVWCRGLEFSFALTRSRFRETDDLIMKSVLRLAIS